MEAASENCVSKNENYNVFDELEEMSVRLEERKNREIRNYYKGLTGILKDKDIGEEVWVREQMGINENERKIERIMNNIG